MKWRRIGREVRQRHFWFFRRQLLLQILIVGIINGDTFSANQFEAFASTQERAVFEHVAAFWVQHPVRALARAIGTARHFDEAIVE